MIKYLSVSPDIEASWVGRVIPPSPPLEALLNADPHRWVLLRIIQRIILYYSALSPPSKSTILPRMADISVEHVWVSSKWEVQEVAVFMKYYPAERIYVGHHTQACPQSPLVMYTLYFISSDRSSCSDDGLLYIYLSTHFFRFSLSPLMQLMLQVSL